MEFSQQIVIIAAFFGVLALGLWELKRRGRVQFGFPGASRTRQLELVERLPLTPNHSLHLVKMSGRRLLIGVSPSGCNLIESNVDKAAQ